MIFNSITHADSEHGCKATVTLYGNEIREIAEALHGAREKSVLRSNWYLLFELTLDGAVDGETFRICQQLREERSDK